MTALLEFYETPPWMVHALLAHTPSFVRGCTIYECCAGQLAIANVIRPHVKRVVCNDIDPARPADAHLDATKPSSWKWTQGWALTNPPFSKAMQIIQAAATGSDSEIYGITMLLRLSFLEPTKGNKKAPGRSEWLGAHPPTQVIVLPRYSFTGDGKSDSVTSAWMTWALSEEAQDAYTGARRGVHIWPNKEATGGCVMEPIWWGYLHKNGTLQLKRWFGDHRDYTDDCYGNEFVVRVIPPFEAATREEAERILATRLGV